LMKEESSCEQEMSADGGLLMGEWYLAPLWLVLYHLLNGREYKHHSRTNRNWWVLWGCLCSLPFWWCSANHGGANYHPPINSRPISRRVVLSIGRRGCRLHGRSRSAGIAWQKFTGRLVDLRTYLRDHA
jgi:hypothetical protein